MPAGSSATQIAMYSFNYTATGQTSTGNNARTSLATASQIGSCWGVAYNRYNDRVYTSALVKRHSGLGPGGPAGSPNPVNAPGSIYLIDPNTTNSGSFFFSMDALGTAYYTHDHTTGNALNVRDNVTRGLNKNINTPSADAAAFDQVGKTGIGDLEISEDGRYLWLTNLYNRKLYRIDLTNPAAPVAPTAATASALITSWNLPTLSCSSILRPWAVKLYRGKIYVGVVCTGETDINTNNTANINTNYNGTTVTGGSYNLSNAYILEFDPSGAGTWATALTIPLSYPRGNAADENFNITRWYNWASNFDVLKAYPGNTSGALIHPQPILSNIEFDVDGTLMIGFMDRLGNQTGYGEYDTNGSSSYYGEVGGDLLRAYNNGCVYELESNGKEGASSPKPATFGANKGEGPGIGVYGAGGTNYGEFYWDERYWYPSGPYWAHIETSLGNLAFLPGSGEIMNGVMDPFDIYSNGVTKFNNTTGGANSRYEIITVAEAGTFRKANSLGDIELILPPAPIEIGNRIWFDGLANGIQDADEHGMANITLNLYSNGADDIAGNADDIFIAATATDAQGNWFFSNSNVVDGNPFLPGNQTGLQPNFKYNVIVASTDWTLGTGIGNLSGYILTTANAVGNGAPGLSNSDAILSSNNVPMISLTTGKSGQNNYDLDMGFQLKSILAVKKIDISAAQFNNSVSLTWVTTEEFNVEDYQLEISANGTDFANLYRAKSKGNGNFKYSYQDDISKSVANYIYYRVKINDKNGSHFYSETIKISVKNNFKFLAGPNPFSNYLVVQFTSLSKSPSTITIINANGQKVFNKVYSVSNGNNSILINEFARIPKGIYFLEVVIDDKSERKKLIKQ